VIEIPVVTFAIVSETSAEKLKMSAPEEMGIEALISEKEKPICLPLDLPDFQPFKEYLPVTDGD